MESKNLLLLLVVRSMYSLKLKKAIVLKSLSPSHQILILQAKFKIRKFFLLM